MLKGIFFHIDYKIIVIVLLSLTARAYSQMTKEDVLTILSLEEYNGMGSTNDVELIYER